MRRHYAATNAEPKQKFQAPPTLCIQGGGIVLESLKRESKNVRCRSDRGEFSWSPLPAFR